MSPTDTNKPATKPAPQAPTPFKTEQVEKSSKGGERK
jgi:hypothetical protein